MAIAKPAQVDHVWDKPVWPPTIPSAERLRLLYGSDADELVVLFAEGRGRDGYFDFIATPNLDYAAIKVAMDSGMIIGVMVYPLAAWAIERHPAWRGALLPNPPAEIARRIVLDIKDLHSRYGLTSEADS
jgi:hypothetical protein